MIFVSFIIALVIILTFLDDKRMLKNGMSIGFFVLTVVFVIRYGYGSDYFSYYDHFLCITKSSSLQAAFDNDSMEKGWIILCWLLKPLGFQSLIVLQTVITNYIIYYLIRKHVSRGWRWFAVSFYLLNPMIFLLNLSMLRQGLAQILFLLAVDLAYEKRIVLPLLLIFIAFSFHNSALIAIPFLILAYFSSNKTVVSLTLLTILLSAIILYIKPDVSSIAFNYILLNDAFNDTYGYYFDLSDQLEMSSGLGFLIQILAVVPLFFCFKQFDSFFKITFVNYLTFIVFTLLAFQVLMINRISSYFMSFGILLFPMYYQAIIAKHKTTLINNKANSFLALGSFSLVLFYNVYAYFEFFKSATYGWAYVNFHTIL